MEHLESRIPARVAGFVFAISDVLIQYSLFAEYVVWLFWLSQPNSSLASRHPGNSSTTQILARGNIGKGCKFEGRSEEKLCPCNAMSASRLTQREVGPGRFRLDWNAFGWFGHPKIHDLIPSSITTSAWVSDPRSIPSPVLLGVEYFIATPRMHGHPNLRIPLVPTSSLFGI